MADASFPAPAAKAKAPVPMLWECPSCKGRVNALPHPDTHPANRFLVKGANCPHCLRGVLVQVPALPQAEATA